MFSELTPIEWGVLLVYAVVLVVVSVYGLHRYALVWLYYRHRAAVPRLNACFTDLPRVTVQLPMYNERFVARRIIEKACAIDYPSDRLQVQVLDDSTDDTHELAREVVDEMRGRGHDIELIHRDDRTGYKAGALQAGMATATGDLICIFDADFVPTRDILHSTVHFFTQSNVGDGAGQVGAPQQGAVVVDPRAGSAARRPFHHGARGPQSLAAVHEFQRDRRCLET